MARRTRPFTGDASEVAIAGPLAAIEEVSNSLGNNLGKLLTVVRVGDDTLLGATDTLAAAQQIL